MKRGVTHLCEGVGLSLEQSSGASERNYFQNKLPSFFLWKKYLSDSGRRKAKHASATDVKSISASSVPLFIFVASRVLSKNQFCKLARGAGRRIKRRWNRVQYHCKGKIIRRVDSVWVSTSSRAGRAHCRLLYRQSKHFHRELREEEDPQAFERWFEPDTYQRERRTFLNEKLKTETLDTPPPPPPPQSRWQS